MIKFSQIVLAVVVSLVPVALLAQPAPPVPPAHRGPGHRGDAGVMPPGHHPGMTPPAGRGDGGAARPTRGGNPGMPPMGGGAMRRP